MERFQNIKESIKNAKNIKIIFPRNPNNDVLGSVLALYSAFKQLNKQVFVPEERLSEEIIHFLRGEKKKIYITLNEEISEIYYEKKGDHVNLNIIPKDQNFNADNFSWEIVSEKNNASTGEHTEPLDLIIIIGVLRFAEIEKYLPTDEEDLFACTIVNIDNDLTNENYGDINIIDESPISKTTTILVKELSEFSFSKEVFDFLLFGFFSQEKISTKNISAIKWIINNGGTLDIYFEYQKKEKPSWVIYFEAALKNISLQEDEEIIFSYLRAEKSNNEQIESTLRISKIFREWINPKAFCLAFREDQQTKPIFYSSLPAIVKKIGTQYKGAFKETGGIITHNEKSPLEAIEELKEFL
ncbi:hypothetical protein M0Q03_03015 [bacterium]|jgi:nanoRNase/pAp phosphatase (c-di-AMP/oligoRNAs hydrolase)|nr:hypothetical protein [bacterium]